MSYLHIERAAEKSTVLFLRPFSVKSTDGLADRLISTQKVKGRKKEGKPYRLAEKCPLLFPERSGRGNIFVLLQGDKVSENFDHLFQRTDGDKFVDGVEVKAAGGEGSPGNEEIGQRTKRKGQPGRQFRLAPKERGKTCYFSSSFMHFARKASKFAMI